MPDTDLNKAATDADLLKLYEQETREQAKALAELQASLESERLKNATLLERIASLEALKLELIADLDQARATMRKMGEELDRRPVPEAMRDAKDRIPFALTQIRHSGQLIQVGEPLTFDPAEQGLELGLHYEMR